MSEDTVTPATAGSKSSEWKFLTAIGPALTVLLSALAAGKEKLGIDYMAPSIIYTVGAVVGVLGLAYIVSRTWFKVAREQARAMIETSKAGKAVVGILVLALLAAPSSASAALGAIAPESFDGGLVLNSLTYSDGVNQDIQMTVTGGFAHRVPLSAHVALQLRESAYALPSRTEPGKLGLASQYTLGYVQDVGPFDLLAEGGLLLLSPGVTGTDQYERMLGGGLFITDGVFAVGYSVYAGRGELLADSIVFTVGTGK